MDNKRIRVNVYVDLDEYQFFQEHSQVAFSEFVRSKLLQHNQEIISQMEWEEMKKVIAQGLMSNKEEFEAFYKVLESVMANNSKK